ncbi:MAG: divalent-cation tolerance protein CutA [Elusimicrobiales bacterium]|nr:divalent-cation tolerance protein CutA [Elusimicrobiales bacterium]
MAQYEICIVSAGDRAVAKKITEALMNEQLAACVSAIEGMKSIFRWKGKMEEADEVLLIIKTRASLREEVMQCVKKNHNYEIPEILFIPVEGSREYLDWIGANTRFSMAEPEKQEDSSDSEDKTEN